MASKARWVVVLALAGGALWLVSNCLGGPPGGSEVINRLWIERLPADERDLIGQFMMVDQRGGRLGLTGKVSRWRHDTELFEWSIENDRLVQEFPQTKTRVESTLRVWECEAPEPFEICLDLESEGDRLRYYSRRDWIIEPGQPVAEITDRPELAGVISLPESPKLSQ